MVPGTDTDPLAMQAWEEGCGRKKKVVLALKTEDHSYLEAFKLLLKAQTPMIKLGSLN